MKMYIDNYQKELNKKIMSNKNLKKLREELITKISFFQAERLIHLLVTITFAFLLLLFLFFSTSNPLYIIPMLICLVLEIFYVKYYFYLENSIQNLYKQYDNIEVKMDNMKDV